MPLQLPAPSSSYTPPSSPPIRSHPQLFSSRCYSQLSSMYFWIYNFKVKVPVSVLFISMGGSSQSLTLLQREPIILLLVLRFGSSDYSLELIAKLAK